MCLVQMHGSRRSLPIQCNPATGGHGVRRPHGGKESGRRSDGRDGVPEVTLPLEIPRTENSRSGWKSIKRITGLLLVMLVIILLLEKA